MQLAVRPPLPTAHETKLANLLAGILELTRRELPSACFLTRVRNVYRLKAVALDSPMLTFPLKGRKQARDADRWIAIEPGEMFLVCHTTTVDIKNLPDPVSGGYTALSILLPEYVLEAARQLLQQAVGAGGGSIACVPMDEHVGDLATWLDATERGDSVRARHALVGIVLRLYAQGYRRLLHPPPPGLSARVRAMIAADPTREWSSAEVESSLGVSGATLRRRLASEGASLRGLIAEARLSHGLSLLMTTQLPVKSVASRVGYASVSSFVKRFRGRYGVDPSRVRGD